MSLEGSKTSGGRSRPRSQKLKSVSSLILRRCSRMTRPYKLTLTSSKQVKLLRFMNSQLDAFVNSSYIGRQEFQVLSYKTSHPCWRWRDYVQRSRQGKPQALMKSTLLSSRSTLEKSAESSLRSCSKHGLVEKSLLHGRAVFYVRSSRGKEARKRPPLTEGSFCCQH